MWRLHRVTSSLGTDDAVAGDQHPSDAATARAASDVTGNCEVCFMQPRTGVALVPCGHTHFCSPCANTVCAMGSKCPLCRTPILVQVHNHLVMHLYQWDITNWCVCVKYSSWLLMLSRCFSQRNWMICSFFGSVVQWLGRWTCDWRSRVKSQLLHCRVQPWTSCSHTLSSASGVTTWWRYIMFKLKKN